MHPNSSPFSFNPPILGVGVQSTPESLPSDQFNHGSRPYNLARLTKPGPYDTWPSYPGAGETYITNLPGSAGEPQPSAAYHAGKTLRAARRAPFLFLWQQATLNLRDHGPLEIGLASSGKHGSLEYTQPCVASSGKHGPQEL